ncbi:Vacuolar membrane protein [Aspergillus sclerotialis]|uniref:Vacuolar membrane protein n=1 Tax=Aspergillus sclerotialis TaxID=2070753 RepID=A0A3A2ZSB9_9EURO|nr:Vacuolar membrane protein [Aspergillus sclerotialis]
MSTTTALVATGNTIIYPTSTVLSTFAMLSTSSPTPSPQSPSYSPAGSGNATDGEDNGECRLLGPFSLLVQAALGALALSSLVYKRWKERPQRPVKVWAFDVSKQVFGSAMLHLANLLMSMFSAGQFEIKSDYKPNPCSFYLLNLGIDTTLGIPILILILRILNILALYTFLANPPESIESGNYGHPPSAAWWFKQSMIYFVGLLGMKICVFFLIHLVPFIVKVGDWALRWTEGNTAVQIFFVMLLFPLIMNALQYYIIDTFIKKPLSHSHDLLTQEDDFDDSENHQCHSTLLGLEDDGVIEGEEDSMGKGDGTVLKATMQPNPGMDQHRSQSIDTEDIPTVSSAVASSSSSRDDSESGPKSTST